MKIYLLSSLIIIMLIGCTSQPEDGSTSDKMTPSAQPSNGVRSDIPDKDVSSEITISNSPEFPHRYPDVKPQSIAHAIDVLNVVIKNEDKIAIREMPKEDLIDLHFGLGMWIRNNFGLWSGNESLHKELGDPHPDDASMVLIEAYWMHLNKNEKQPDKAIQQGPPNGGP